VFLLGPEDYHYFEIDEHTFFNYIRFTEAFIKEASSARHKEWIRTIETLLKTPYQSNGSVIKKDSEKLLLDNLLIVLIEEYNNRQHSFFETVMDGLMKVILSIIARNIVHTPGQDANEKSQSLFEELLGHIRLNICNPQNLRVEYLAETFHYSPSYLSTYFKKQAGESLQQFILKYKLKQVENRLKYSGHTISQIAHEFCFTDESHFNKTFKKYYGVAPRDFRKQVVVEGELVPEKLPGRRLCRT
jgi:AraC-like DNA-binding protein